MKTILVTLAFIPFCFFGQNVNHKDLKNNKADDGYYKSYTSEEGKVYNVGDVFLICNPNNLKRLIYPLFFKSDTTMPIFHSINQAHLNRKIKIIEILVSSNEEQKNLKMTFSTLRGKYLGAFYLYNTKKFDECLKKEGLKPLKSD